MLDVPGEFFLDLPNQKLYLYPWNAEPASFFEKTLVELTTLRTLISLGGESPSVPLGVFFLCFFSTFNLKIHASIMHIQLTFPQRRVALGSVGCVLFLSIPFYYYFSSFFYKF
jgi:hypothetical protein